MSSDSDNEDELAKKEGKFEKKAFEGITMKEFS